MWIALVVPLALLLLALLLQRLEETVLTDLDASRGAGRDLPDPHDERVTSIRPDVEDPAQGGELVDPAPAGHVTRASA